MFDIASLKIEGDATDLTKLISGLDQLTAASQRYHTAGERTKAVTQSANVAHRGLAADMQRLTQGTDAFSRAQAAAVGTASRQASALRELTQQRRLEAAAMREAVAADKAYERSLAQTERAVDRLRMSYDPLRSVIDRTNKELAEASRLYNQGAINAAEYARAQSVLTSRLNTLNTTHGKVATGTRLTAHEAANLSYQLNDVAVSLASGQKPWMVAIQQGAQIGQIYKSAGASLGGFIAGVVRSVGSMLPMVAVITAAAFAIDLLIKKFTAASEKTKEAAKWWDELNESLADTAPLLNAQATAADLAAEGSKNLSAWLQSAAEKAGNYAEQLKTATVNSYLLAASQAAIKAQELRDANVTRNSRGVLVYRGLDGSTGQAAYRLEQEAADAKVEWAQERARQAMAAPLKAFQPAEHAKKMRDVASATEKAAEATDELIKALRQEIEAVGLTEREQRQLQIARMIAEAPLERQKVAIAQLGKEREAALAVVEAREALRTVTDKIGGYRSNSDQERSLRQSIALNAAYASGQEEIVAQTRLAIDVENNWVKALKAVDVEIVKTTDSTQEMADDIETATDRANRLAYAFDDVKYSLSDMLRAMRSGDIGGFLLNIQGILSGISALKGQGTQGLLSLGSLAANTIGGRTGRAIGGGLGIAASGLGLGAFAGSAAGAAAFGSAGMASLAPLLATYAAPIAIAAGALYAAAKIFNIGGKPTNAGAGFDLRTGALSGNKRTEETEGAATSAGQAILGIMDSLKAAGIGIKDAVTGLVIGTRDQTQIYLESGKTLYSAVGDAGAAVDTAFKAMIEGATYVSETQQKLVESLLATGAGFDKINEALAAYEAAQALPQAFADAILALSDPKAYDTTMLQRAQTARRGEVTAAFDAGYITADQLAAINVQLETLEGLELDEVMKRYTDAVTDATRIAQQRADLEIQLMRAQGDEAGALARERAMALEALDPALRALQQSVWDTVEANTAAQTAANYAAGQLADTVRAVNDNVAASENVAREAYSREVAQAEATIDQYQAIADSLRQFREGLSLGPFSALNPMQQAAAARRAFNGTTGLDGLENVQAVSEAFLTASRATAPDQRAYARDLAAVREKVAASEKLAGEQVDVATAQLNTLNSMATQLGILNNNIISFAQAVTDLANARALQQVVTGGPAPTTGYASTNGDYAAFVAGNSDLLAAYNAYGAARGQTMADFGRQVWEDPNSQAANRTRGVQAFASGGFHTGGLRLVGEEGPELEVTGPSRIFSATETRQMMGGDSPEHTAALERQNALIAEQNVVLRRIEKAVTSTDKTLTQVTEGGNAMLTEAAA